MQNLLQALGLVCLIYLLSLHTMLYLRGTLLILTVILCSVMIKPILAIDYDKQHLLECSQLTQIGTNLQLNLSALWNILILHQIDKICFLIICPIILFLQIVVIVTYIKSHQLRVKPGNIFFGIVCIEMALNIHLLINAIYRTIFSGQAQMPPSFIGFCLSMAIFSSIFTLLHFLYLIMFMFYTIFVFRFSLKKKSQIFWKVLHAFVIIISFVITIFFYFEDFMGLNFYGLCGLSATRKLNWNLTLPILQIISSLIFTFLGIFTYVYFRKHMPAGQNFRKRKQQQSKIIFMYVTGFSLFLILMSVMSLLLDVNCIRPQPIPELNILILIINLIRLVQFSFLLFLILYNQRFRKRFQHTLKSIFQRNHNIRANSDLTEIIQIEDVIFDEKLLEIKQLSNQIDLLLLSQVYTIISGVYIAYFEFFRNCQKKQEEAIRRINYRQSILFQIDHQSTIIYQTEARLIIKLKILCCNMIIHSPNVFRKLLALQGLNNVYESFRIVDNSRKLSNLAEGKGGKSGQFFFFSSDNKYVIKTITFQEFQFYSENLQTFYEYYLENPKSLLAKILGLFTIKGDQMQRKYYLILMKNILGCNRNQILRLYDLKGSKYDRQVLFQETEINQVSKMTLKDIDFVNYETRLKISIGKAFDLRQTLRKDSKFLKSLNLLDYSLLIVRVRWQTPPEQLNFWGELQRIPHQSEPNEYYHIGVIDYMQKWDLQKKGEKWWKNLLGKKDVSAEEPYIYQQRFMWFVDEITTAISSPRKAMAQRQQQHTINIQLKDVRAFTAPNKQNQNQNMNKVKQKQRSTNKI